MFIKISNQAIINTNEISSIVEEIDLDEVIQIFENDDVGFKKDLEPPTKLKIKMKDGSVFQTDITLDKMFEIMSGKE